MVPSTEVREGPAYHRLQAAARPGAWRSVVGVLALPLVVFIVAPIGWLGPFLAWYVVTGADVLDSMERLLNMGDPTPAGLAYLNLTLATAIPVAWLLAWTLHGMRPGWLSSVGPRLRWRWLGLCLGLSVLALVATVVVATLLPDQGMGMDGGELNEFTSTVRDFALVVLLLTPLQAAGEEYAFRGYLTQACGRFGTVAAVVVPALLFALAHGIGQSVPIFVDRFAFGLVAGLLVILTGGLEAAIAMHVLNNFLAFGLALAFGDMGNALNPTGGSWWGIPVTLTQSLVYLALAVWAARRLGVATRAHGPGLVAPRTAV